MHRFQGPAALATAGVAALALALTGCGSSSKSSSTSTSSSASKSTSTSAAATVKPRPIPAVSSPAGASAPGKDTLAKLGKVKRGSGVQAHLGGLGKLPLPQAIQEASGDINHFWSQVFAQANVQWPAMQDVIVDSQPVQTQCSGRSTIAPSDPWFLCDAQGGGTFYWTVPWTQQNIATDQGGVNLVFHMAELWSLHLLNIVGATQQLQSGSLSKASYAQATTCLTGVYVNSLNSRQLFEAGDQQSVASFVQSLDSIPGIGAPDVTAQQLQSAFQAGFQSGQPSTCGLGGGSSPSTPTTPSNPSTPTTPASPNSPQPISPVGGKPAKKK